MVKKNVCGTEDMESGGRWTVVVSGAAMTKRGERVLLYSSKKEENAFFLSFFFQLNFNIALSALRFIVVMCHTSIY
jgi:hypothetical protein